MGGSNSAGKLRSVGGYLVYHCGNLVSWKCVTHKPPALSSAESELYSITIGAQEAMYIKNVLRQTESDYTDGFLLLCDNQAAVQTANSLTYKGRLKHLDVKYHYIRYLVSEKQGKVKHVSTHVNPADILTKPLPSDLHLRHRDAILTQF